MPQSSHTRLLHHPCQPTAPATGPSGLGRCRCRTRCAAAPHGQGRGDREDRGLGASVGGRDATVSTEGLRTVVFVGSHPALWERDGPRRHGRCCRQAHLGARRRERYTGAATRHSTAASSSTRTRSRHQHTRLRATPHDITPRHATPYHATPHHTTPRHATPYHTCPRHWA